jgi:hypothetical protein
MPFFLPGATLADYEDHVVAFGPSTVAGAAPKYLNMANVDVVEVVVQGLNGSTVTGSAITLTQAKSQAGANAKALSFSVHYKNEDATNTTAGSALAKVATTNSTFTTVTTNTANYVYRIPVKGAALDVANGFSFLGVAAANATNTTLSITYRVMQKLSGAATNNPNLF